MLRTEFWELPELKYTLVSVLKDDLSSEVWLSLDSAESGSAFLLCTGSRKTNNNGSSSLQACCSDALVVCEPVDYDGSGILNVKMEKTDTVKRLPDVYFRILLNGQLSSTVTAPFTIKKRISEGIAFSLEALAIDQALRGKDHDQVKRVTSRLAEEKKKLSKELCTEFVLQRFCDLEIRPYDKMKVIEQLSDPEVHDVTFSMIQSDFTPGTHKNSKGKRRLSQVPIEVSKQSAATGSPSVPTPKKKSRSPHDAHIVLESQQSAATSSSSVPTSKEKPCSSNDTYGVLENHDNAPESDHPVGGEAYKQHVGIKPQDLDSEQTGTTTPNQKGDPFIFEPDSEPEEIPLLRCDCKCHAFVIEHNCVFCPCWKFGF